MQSKEGPVPLVLRDGIEKARQQNSHTGIEESLRPIWRRNNLQVSLR